MATEGPHIPDGVALDSAEAHAIASPVWPDEADPSDAMERASDAIAETAGTGTIATAAAVRSGSMTTIGDLSEADMETAAGAVTESYDGDIRGVSDAIESNVAHALKGQLSREQRREAAKDEPTPGFDPDADSLSPFANVMEQVDDRAPRDVMSALTAELAAQPDADIEDAVAAINEGTITELGVDGQTAERVADGLADRLGEDADDLETALGEQVKNERATGYDVEVDRDASFLEYCEQHPDLDAEEMRDGAIATMVDTGDVDYETAREAVENDTVDFGQFAAMDGAEVDGVDYATANVFDELDTQNPAVYAAARDAVAHGADQSVEVGVERESGGIER